MCATRSVQAVQGAGQRLADDGGARLLVGGQRVQPGRAAAPPGPPAAARPSAQRTLLDDEQPRAREPRPLEHPAQVGGHLGGRLGRHPVEHDGERGAALLRRPQQVPGDGVGVAGRRRHEHPEVGRGEQLPGQLAVGLDDGVDVRGVEQGEAGGQVVADDQLHRPGAARPTGDARQVRAAPGRRRTRRRRRAAQTSTGERVVGRSTPAVVTGAPDEAVDERGLAGAGGAADDGEQRGAQVAQPGQQVVVDLVDDARGRRATRRPGRRWPGPAGRPRAGRAARTARRGAGGSGAVTPRLLPRRAESYPCARGLAPRSPDASSAMLARSSRSAWKTRRRILSWSRLLDRR